ncbi:hypothetical protein B0I35DRAFT_445791 [Stachybotrys elegans]|uniref:Uncharacterized protein n=1 Tax=Stachybotrys elegans TaxID=80388 RepID=A0A8K0WJJ5_9HYPO|nr:hypothetical protein B0I35DRAFT_445791 [Stachybotrys elegans]
MAAQDKPRTSEASLDKAPYEWPLSNLARIQITNRNVGSPSTINVMVTFPTPSRLDTARLEARLAQVQELWPLLCVTIVGQRTPQPKMQHHYTQWETNQVLAYETYDAVPGNRAAERDAVYERALRLFQTKVSFDKDPQWRVTIFRAAQNAENERLYFSLTIDHVLIDGRGTVKLVNALLADDISSLPKEEPEFYHKAALGLGMDELPPYTFILSTIYREVLRPRLPFFIQRWLGYHPVWPQTIPQPTIDSPWKSSIHDLSIESTQLLKQAGKKHEIATLNPSLHTAWIVALWAVFIGQKQEGFRDISVKDLRDVSKGDPYCLGGNATVFMWSSGILTPQSRFWQVAQAYAAVSTDAASHEEGTKFMKMLNLAPDKALDPESCTQRAPDASELPAGDKRAHNLHEEEALKKINSLSPYGNMSGIWSNLSYFPLPKGAIDMVFGVSGNATGTAFNTCLIGHEQGVRVQNAYSDGAAMREDGMKKAEQIFAKIIAAITSEQERDWSLAELLELSGQ